MEVLVSNLVFECDSTLPSMCQKSMCTSVPHRAIYGHMSAGKGTSFGNHAPSGWGKTYRESREPCYIWPEKGKEFQKPQPIWAGKKSFSNHVLYGLEKGASFRLCHACIGGKQGFSQNAIYLGGKREQALATMSCRRLQTKCISFSPCRCMSIPSICTCFLWEVDLPVQAQKMSRPRHQARPWCPVPAFAIMYMSRKESFGNHSLYGQEKEESVSKHTLSGWGKKKESGKLVIGSWQNAVPE